MCLILSMTQPLFAQLSDNDYQKALWMTTRMYGGQRSGSGPNWITMDHNVNNNGKTRNGVDFINDSDGTYDLSGGWHDCGDHVKFGQTQYYSAYMLLLGYDAFPTGYDDYYSFNYSGYQATQDFSWESADGTPNGIPDILDEVKYATDYFIKCTKDGSTFYSQVGNGNYDHQQWVTSVYMSTLSENNGGETRDIKKDPNDASMASFCGATLALMSRHYRKFDAAYADLCLEHAEYAYTYASNHKTNSGGGTVTGGFYSSDNNWRDNYVCLCTELYLATGTTAYKTEAESYWTSGGNYIQDQWWVLDFENSQDLALYSLKRLGFTTANAKWSNLVSYYQGKKDGQDLILAGGSWGRLRYCANAAFVLALNQQLNAQTTPEAGVIGTADYILGDNSANQSFVVGFGTKAPTQPHHRNVYLDDNNDINNVSIPSRNAQHGFMVGGTNNPGSFPDDINNYQTSEGCIDYQAGLVGLLGYIVSTKTPVDTSKFGAVTGVDPLVVDNEIRIYPNPTIETITVSLPVGIQNIQILNNSGQILEIPMASNSSEWKLNLSELPTAQYFLIITDDSNNQYIRTVNRQ